MYGKDVTESHCAPCLILKNDLSLDEEGPAGVDRTIVATAWYFSASLSASFVAVPQAGVQPISYRGLSFVQSRLQNASS
ncbi:hypothetical protein RRF57_008853 [Xylaria bambusicola]|uniref:Uncharacterized protein n=1 Tax=Xylaria bambusicola TaxID=326684 RepID=A0AAN7V246_9PEZI